MVQLFDKRPPFVRFEEREMGLNPEATEAAGRPIPRIVIMACITNAGSKDCFEKIADEWLADKHKQSLNNLFPVEWVQLFRAQFEAFKQGHELPRDGTPIKTWAMCTREAGTRLLACGITTVEDLAEFPDSNLSVIGMDGRYLRDMARGWINEAKDKGANAKALADANVRIGTLQGDNERLSERLQRLEARLEARQDEEPARRGPGRPRKSEEAA
jgi:hypothetical protein